jgi:hypothetical protein
MELKNFKEHKFIVASGCSYGVLPKSVFSPFNSINKTIYPNKMDMNLYNQYGRNWLEIDDNIILLNVSLGSQGSDWQSDSTIHICQKLLECGVKSENIYVLVEWSQWRRIGIHPFNYINIDMNCFDWSKGHDFFYDYINKDNLLFKNENFSKGIFNELEITTSNKIFNIGKIKERVYISPFHMCDEKFNDSKNNLDYLLKVSKDLDEYLPLENKLKIYLNNILRTQYFLKNNNIKYNFIFMQTTLSNWHKTENGLVYHELKSPFDSNFNPKNNNETDIEYVLSETKLEINQIDFSNFWLYENEKYRRGGIDDWTLDNFKEVGYINLHEDFQDYVMKEELVPKYGGHPNTVPYLLLWNKVTTNCDFVKVRSDFEDFMLEKFWEDYNYNGFSKNFVTISKKEWDKRLKQ